LNSDNEISPTGNMLFAHTPPVQGAPRRRAGGSACVPSSGAGEVFYNGKRGGAGTASFRRAPKLRVLRAAMGWLAARGSRMQVVLRAATGWLAARGLRIFRNGGSERELGTAFVPDLNDSASRTGSGWFSVRVPEDFELAGGGEYHKPVMADEVSEWMRAGPGKRIVDGTLGGGGHSEAFLKAGAEVVGIDRDPEALTHARQRLQRFGDRFQAVESDFGDVENVVGEKGADGLLLDLGVSSRQVDAPDRGFSFTHEGPLDMRMGPSVELTAADVVNGFPEEELARIFRELGEEKAARRIARAIVRRRSDRPFRTTTELASCVETANKRRGRRHPATKTFQAIRMTVNDELGSLRRVLDSASRVLRPGGRLLVISFHSLEDRMVKRFLRESSAETVDRPEWPAARPNPKRAFRLLNRRGVTPTEEEIARNPRARSARLRVGERIEEP